MSSCSEKMDVSAQDVVNPFPEGARRGFKFDSGESPLLEDPGLLILCES